jgi:UDP-galactopyranose mutase
VHGYTRLVENLLDHPHLDVRVGRPFGRSDAQGFDHVFYTGSIDRWFEYDAGPLGYRSLLFERLVERGDHQGTAQINYCEEKVPYTRVTEFKHFTPWEEHELTVCFRETSVPAMAGDPLCYPLPFGARAGPIKEYLERAHRERRVTFLGRLATYRYLDMHVVVAEALDLARKVLETPGLAERWPRFTGVPVPFDA